MYNSKRKHAAHDMTKAVCAALTCVPPQAKPHASSGKKPYAVVWYCFRAARGCLRTGFASGDGRNVVSSAGRMGLGPHTTR
jgi:hypothetical protein